MWQWDIRKEEGMRSVQRCDRWSDVEYIFGSSILDSMRRQKLHLAGSVL
jgi:hypothetical protein